VKVINRSLCEYYTRSPAPQSFWSFITHEFESVGLRRNAVPFDPLPILDFAEHFIANGRDEARRIGPLEGDTSAAWLRLCRERWRYVKEVWRSEADGLARVRSRIVPGGEFRAMVRAPDDDIVNDPGRIIDLLESLVYERVKRPKTSSSPYLGTCRPAMLISFLSL
jgi:hypothetical protein